MREPLLSSVRVVDLAGKPAATVERMLADLRAGVVLIEPPGGSGLPALPNQLLTRAARRRSVAFIGADDTALELEPDAKWCPRDEGAVE